MPQTAFAALTFAPLSKARLDSFADLVAALPVVDTPEDPATPERIAAHQATAISLAATALQHALCSSRSIDLVNDALCGPVTVAAAEEFVTEQGDAVLAGLIRAHWIARESATAGILCRPDGWLNAIVTGS